jgi:hypothetical protein
MQQARHGPPVDGQAPAERKPYFMVMPAARNRGVTRLAISRAEI